MNKEKYKTEKKRMKDEMSKEDYKLEKKRLKAELKAKKAAAEGESPVAPAPLTAKNKAKGNEDSGYIKAGGFIDVGEDIKAGRSIQAGEYIKAGGSINAGEYNKAVVPAKKPWYKDPQWVRVLVAAATLVIVTLTFLFTVL